MNKYVFPSEVNTEELVRETEKIAADPSVHGMMVFMPLPEGIDQDRVRNAIPPEKDMDGASDLAIARTMANRPGSFAPCTAEACIEMLKAYDIETKGKRAVVIGRSMVIGKPVAMLLLAEQATVTICHTRTKKEDLLKYCREADIVVVAAGHPGTFTKEMASPGQTVLDVGINVDEEGHLFGDADFEGIKDIVSAATPVPGGIGTVTNTVLMKHVAEACRAAKKSR